MSRRLILVRHGQTSWNAIGLAQGHADVQLDFVGHAQAAAVAPYLAALEPVALWSSDLVRARETCAYVEKASGLIATYDERLREFDVGERQGLTMAEFAVRFPQEHESWVSGDARVRLRGAEVHDEVRTRMLPALRECLCELLPGQTGIVLTHGAALKVGVVALLGWSAELAAGLRVVDNCAWVTVSQEETTGRLRLAGYNQSLRPGHEAPHAG